MEIPKAGTRSTPALFGHHPDMGRGGLIPHGKGRGPRVLAERDEALDAPPETWATLAAEYWRIHSQQWRQGGSQASEGQTACCPCSPPSAITIYFRCQSSPQFTYKVYHQKLSDFPNMISMARGGGCKGRNSVQMLGKSIVPYVYGEIKSSLEMSGSLSLHLQQIW